MLRYIYLQDSSDRIGMCIHQASVRHTVYQPALKHISDNNMKTLTLQMISKLKKNKTNVSSPLFGGSHSKPWSCTRWHSAGSAIALHHAHSRGPPSARTSCSLLRWSLWKPLMAGQHSYQHTIRTLWRRQRPAYLCHFSQSFDVCILSAFLCLHARKSNCLPTWHMLSPTEGSKTHFHLSSGQTPADCW